MNLFKENDCVAITRPVLAEVIGEGRKVVLPAGTVATIVFVYEKDCQHAAYEIEAYLGDQDVFTLATVKLIDIGLGHPCT